jgi:fatty-acyl-CoA synthase
MRALSSVEGRTLPQALEAAARTDAGYCFVSGGTDRWRSYAELRHASMRMAGSLREAGVRRGDLVALVLSDAEQFLIALFGVSIAGATPASLYPPSPTSDLPRYVERTATTLRASAARAVLTTRALTPALTAARPLCPQLALVLAVDDLDAPPLEPDREPALDDIAFVQFTSGSTSSPKGVALTHANLWANIEAFGGSAGVATSADDVGVSWLPLSHDMGLVGMALGALYGGRPCVLLPPQAFVKRPADWLRAITRHGATVSFAPNFAYDLCVRRVKDLSGLDLSSWRVAGCGAEPIHAPTLAAFAEKFAPAGFRDTSFLPCYGLAEHVLAATVARRECRPRIEHISADGLAPGRVALVQADRGRTVALVSCGFALPGHELRIAGEDGRPLPEGHVGEIVLAGPSVMRGYYNQPALTAETIREGWLRTGDLGYLSAGELFVCGRAKDLIIVNGRKYHPEDLEGVVDRIGGVRPGRVAAFGVRCGDADRVVIVVEPDGTTPPDGLVGAVRREIADTFALAVDDVVLVRSGTINRTTSGKVQRAATRARYERGELGDEATRRKS